MKIKKLSLTPLFCFVSIFGQQDAFFVFVIASFNNAEKYYHEKTLVELNLESIFAQEYTNYHILYCDDASTDETEKAVLDCCIKHNKLDKLTYIKNKINNKALFSIYNAIHCYCKDSDIVLLLDGDDWLINDSHILEYFNTIYQNQDIWATYGEFISLHSADGSHGVNPYSISDLEEKICRYQPFYFTHMRTFYAGLFKKIKITDFLHSNDFFYYAWDLPIALPLLEMAGHHIYYNPKPIYVYNNILTTNDHALNQHKQIYFDFLTRNKNKYQPLENLYDNSSSLKICHLTFVNQHTNESLLANQINDIHQYINFSSTIACLPNRNHHLCSVPFFQENTHIIPNCHYHSWISDTIVLNLKNTFIQIIDSAECDYFILTETGDKIVSLSNYKNEILALADIIVIGAPHIPLSQKTLALKHPNIRFVQLGRLGTYLNFKEPSCIIISKNKLLNALKKGLWINGSYLGNLGLISNIYASEYAAFIATF